MSTDEYVSKRFLKLTGWNKGTSSVCPYIWTRSLGSISASHLLQSHTWLTMNLLITLKSGTSSTLVWPSTILSWLRYDLHFLHWCFKINLSFSSQKFCSYSFCGKNVRFLCFLIIFSSIILSGWSQNLSVSVRFESFK